MTNELSAQPKLPNRPSSDISKLNIKEAKGVKRFFRIIDDSPSLVLVKDEIFSVAFKYSAKFDTIITMHFFAKCILDSMYKIHIFRYRKNTLRMSDCVRLPTSSDGKVENSFQIDLSGSDMQELVVADKATFPIIIEAYTKDGSTNDAQSLICCYKIGQGFKLELVMQIIKIGDNYITLKNLFGISCVENESECLICLSEIRSVAVLPCRHVCYCEICTEQVKASKNFECPICRGRVESFILIKHD